LDDSYCDNPTFSLTGALCQPRKPDGAACSLPIECESYRCRDDSCVPADRDAAYCLAE
jgi:hypothetical protein